MSTSDDPREGEREPLIKVSTLIAGAAAAVTSTLIAGRLGVTGTLLGAGLISVMTTLALAIYTRSLEHVTAPRRLMTRIVAAVRTRVARGPALVAASVVVAMGGVMAVFWSGSTAPLEANSQLAASAVATSAATAHPVSDDEAVPAAPTGNGTTASQAAPAGTDRPRPSDSGTRESSTPTSATQPTTAPTQAPIGGAGTSSDAPTPTSEPTPTTQPTPAEPTTAPSDSAAPSQTSSPDTTPSPVD